MSVHIRCENCNCSYHEVTSSEWNTSGTVTRYDGYCGYCYDGSSTTIYNPSGNVVKMNCKDCSDTYMIVTWSDWSTWGTISIKSGYCTGCTQMKKMQDMMDKISQLTIANADAQKRIKEAKAEAEEKFMEEKKQMEQKFEEKQKEERKQNEIKSKQTTLESRRLVLKSKKESLVVIKQELSKIENSVKIEEGKLNNILTQVQKQTEDISRKWVNMDIGIRDSSDEKTFDGKDCVFEKIKLLENKLSKMRVIICIGKTGLGKSTFLNRMIGDTSYEGDGNYDSDDDDDNSSTECKNELFKVGSNVKSETSEVNHKFITNNNTNGEIYCLVDTPGSLDSYGRDNEHTNNISEYLRGCGGVNTFCVFVSLCEGTIDKTYIELLQLYNNMLGENWWNHVLFIGTKFDSYLAGKPKLKRKTETKKQEILNNRFNEIIEQFKDNKELNIPNNIQLKLIPIGHDNYENATKQVLLNVSKNKFNCNKIISPLNKLTNEAKQQEKFVNDIKKDKDKIENKLKGVENEIKSIEQDILNLENEIKQLETSIH